MLLGIAVNLYGRVSIQPTVFIVGTTIVTFIMALILYALFMSPEGEEWLKWFVLIICILIGLTSGYFMQKYIRIGIGILGGGAGMAIGLLLCTLFKLDSVAWFWLILIALFIVFGLISYKVSDNVMILSTSMIGSYTCIRGISMYWDNSYPNEFELAKQLSSGVGVTLPWSFFVFMTLMIFSFIGGCYF